MLEEKKMADKNEGISRRDFMAKAGALTAGMAVAGGIMGALVTGKAEAVAVLPFPYKRLNLDQVRKRAFDAYFEANCCYGAAKGLLVSLREVCGPGSPWDNIPIDLFKFGGGGVNSWGTLCGALNGSLYVMNMAAGSPKVNGIGNELMGWYTKFPFPTTKLDTYSPFKSQVKTVANSPLCHNSVSIWCETAGARVNSDAKKHRCAKLTGDVAAKAAELMNALLVYKTFVPAFKFDADTNFCMSCHAPGNSTTPNTDPQYNLDNEQGKMTCGECHDDEHNHAAYSDDCSVCHK